MSDEISLARGWTLEAYIAHNEAMRSKRIAHGVEVQRWQDRWQFERDRRYSELAVEREKALKIKETADLAALQLAREIQTYKDEKANELRAQIERERGTYATKNDLIAAVEKIEETIKPIAGYVASQQGRAEGIGVSANTLVVVVTILIAAVGLYFGTH